MAEFPFASPVASADAYTPVEIVEGVRTPEPMPRAASALAGQSAAYAEELDSFALIVAKDGAVVAEHYWQGFGPDSRFSTASMHKPVLALAFGAAVSRGLIGLSDPVAEYLPAWRGDPRGDITLQQLLSMASGLASPPLSRDPASAGMAMMFGDDVTAAALSLDAAEAPGQTFAYANANSQLAGAALAAAVPGRYAEWLSQTIWKPIGAADAALWLDRPDGSPHYFCCLQARARDWLRVGELIRQDGRFGGRQVVPAHWIERMTAPSELNPNFGLQIWRGSPYAPQRRYSAASPVTIPASEPFAADDVVFIDGFGGQRVYIVPSLALTVVRIGKARSDWDDSALINLVIVELTGLAP